MTIVTTGDKLYALTSELSCYKIGVLITYTWRTKLSLSYVYTVLLKYFLFLFHKWMNFNFQLEWMALWVRSCNEWKQANWGMEDKNWLEWINGGVWMNAAVGYEPEAPLPRQPHFKEKSFFSVCCLALQLSLLKKRLAPPITLLLFFHYSINGSLFAGASTKWRQQHWNGDNGIVGMECGGAEGWSPAITHSNQPINEPHLISFHFIPWIQIAFHDCFWFAVY